MYGNRNWEQAIGGEPDRPERELYSYREPGKQPTRLYPKNKHVSPFSFSLIPCPTPSLAPVKAQQEQQQQQPPKKKRCLCNEIYIKICKAEWGLRKRLGVDRVEGCDLTAVRVE